ncbi:hypothetical protein HKX48_004731 [Thoreauomyces humboldtii]|nr:hypothetical protein HKX48_004731 [Thoreauomyces humboldtii]
MLRVGSCRGLRRASALNSKSTSASSFFLRPQASPRPRCPKSLPSAFTSCAQSRSATSSAEPSSTSTTTTTTIPTPSASTSDAPSSQQQPQPSSSDVPLSGPRADIAALFDQPAAGPSRKISIFQAFMALDRRRKLGEWRSADYRAFINRYINNTGRDERTLASIQKVHAVMKRLDVRIDADLAWDLVTLYSDLDRMYATTYFRAVDKLQILRSRPEPVNRQTRYILQRLETDLKVEGAKTVLKDADALVEQVLLSSKEFGPRSVNVLFRMFATRRDIASVEKWIQKVGESDLEPTSPTYGHIVAAYGRAGDLYNAQQWYENYLQSNLVRAEIVFTSFAEALGQAGQVQAARDILEKTMVQEKVVPTLATYKTLLSLLIRNGETTAAKEILTRLQSNTGMPSPDYWTFLAVFEGATLKGDIELATVAYENIRSEQGLRKSKAVSLSNYGELCVTKGRLSDAVAIFNQFYQHGARPDPLFTEALCDALIRSEDKAAALKLWETAYEALQQVRRGKYVADPNLATLIPRITTIADGNMALLLQLQRVTNSHNLYGLLGQPREVLLEEFDKQSKTLQLTSSDYEVLYTTLFSFHTRVNSVANIPATHKYAFRFLDDLVAKNLKPTTELSDLVLRAFERRSMTSSTAQWIHRMKALEVPTPELSAEQQEALDNVFTETQKRQLENDLAKSSKAHDVKEVLRICAEFERRKVLPQPFYIGDAIKSFGRVLDFETVSQIIAVTSRISAPMASDTRIKYVGVAATGAFNAFTSAGMVPEAADILRQSQSPVDHYFKSFHYETLFAKALAARPTSLNKETYLNIGMAFDAYRTIFKSKNIEMAPVHWETVMKLMHQGKLPAEVRKIWEMLQVPPYHPSISAYCYMIASSGKAGDVAEAESVFEKYVDEHWDGLNMLVMDTMIKAQVLNGNVNQAAQVLQIALSRGLQPTETSFETLIRGMASNPTTLPDAMQFFGRMKEAFPHRKIDPAVYGELIKAATKTKDMATLDLLLEEMTSGRVRPIATSDLEQIVQMAVAEGQTDLAARYARRGLSLY